MQARCEEAKRRRWEGQVTLFSLFPATLNGALDDVLLLWQRTPKAPPPSFGGLLLGGGAVAAAGAVLMVRVSRSRAAACATPLGAVAGLWLLSSG